MFCVMAWYSGQNETPSGPNETHLGNLYKKWQKGSRIKGKKFIHRDRLQSEGTVGVDSSPSI